MIALQRKSEGSRRSEVFGGGNGLLRCRSSDSQGYPDLACSQDRSCWNNNDTNRASKLGTKENNHETLLARIPSRTSSLDPNVALWRLMEIEQEKRLLEETLRLQSLSQPFSAVSQSPTFMSDDDVVAIHAAQEEELLAEAMKRSMQEM